MSKFLSFLGFKEKSGESGLPKELDDLFTQHLNRPIHKILTEEIIDETLDEYLLQVIFDNLSTKQSKDYENEYEIVMSWNKSRQAIYLIWLLESEVNNGGYDQFYYNSGGEFYKFLPNALKLVGAERFSKLTNEANQVFERENSKINEHQDENPLDKFDDEFYDLYNVENLQELQIDYIRKNKKDFID